MELTIEVRARPGKFQELYQTLSALLPTNLSEKRCRDCRISLDIEDGEVFFFSVHREALASLEHYMQSSSGFALLGPIEVLSERWRSRGA